jgi:hypothetical protein
MSGEQRFYIVANTVRDHAMGLGALAGMSGGPAHQIGILAMSWTNSNAPSRSLPLA